MTAEVGADDVSASLDLRRFGYRQSLLASEFADYSELSFHSDNLLVISINQRDFKDVKTLNADTPESTIVVFDVKRASITTTGQDGRGENERIRAGDQRRTVRGFK